MKRILNGTVIGFLLGLLVWAVPIIADAVRDFREAARESRQAAERFNEASKRVETMFK